MSSKYLNLKVRKKTVISIFRVATMLKCIPVSGAAISWIIAMYSEMYLVIICLTYTLYSLKGIREENCQICQHEPAELASSGLLCSGRLSEAFSSWWALRELPKENIITHTVARQCQTQVCPWPFETWGFIFINCHWSDHEIKLELIGDVKAKERT